MIRADSEGWTENVKHNIEEGINFLLILPNDPEEVTKFCKLFGLPPDCAPKSLNRSGFFRLSQFMDQEVFDEVLANWEPHKQVVFVEQIDFPINRPPRMQPFLVYSPILGMVGQSAAMAGAKEVLADYERQWGSPLPEASIYLWQKGRWNLYEGR